MLINFVHNRRKDQEITDRTKGWGGQGGDLFRENNEPKKLEGTGIPAIYYISIQNLNCSKTRWGRSDSTVTQRTQTSEF